MRCFFLHSSFIHVRAVTFNRSAALHLLQSSSSLSSSVRVVFECCCRPNQPKTLLLLLLLFLFLFLLGESRRRAFSFSFEEKQRQSHRERERKSYSSATKSRYSLVALVHGFAAEEEASSRNKRTQRWWFPTTIFISRTVVCNRHRAERHRNHRIRIDEETDRENEKNEGQGKKKSRRHRRRVCRDASGV